MRKIRRSGSTKVTNTLAALSGIGIILGKFLAFNVTEFMRFSLENITIIFAGIVFGPLLGAVVGAVQDLIGCIIVGYAINPIITLGSAAVGLVSGYVFSKLNRTPLPVRLSLSVLSAHAIGSVLIKSLGLAIFYSLPFAVTALWRVLNYIIVGAAEIFVLYTLLKSKHLLAQINKITKFDASKRLASVSDVSDFAKNTSGVFSKPGLERVSELLCALGNPEKKINVVHVAGTNGKGSVSTMLSSILKQSGLTVGSFNSPYLYEMRESIRIDGEPISEETLVELFERLKPIADGMADKPTEFELLTAAAYLAFYEAEVDVAVVECGMGGEGDATNVIDSPLLSIITGIAIDHTSYLGTTLSEIAKKKAGIIKSGCPVLVGKVEGEALRVIQSKAIELSAPLYNTEGEITVKELSLKGTTLDIFGIKDVKLSLLGLHQQGNAALAIKAAKILADHFPTVTDESIKMGILAAKWQGRFEILKNDPIFIFDGAHNLDGIKNAVESIKVYFTDKVICLCGVLADKEYEAMADEIAKVASHAVTITPLNPRALSSRAYAELLSQKGVDATEASSIAEGVRKALKLAIKKDTAVICLGSLYLYKDVRDALLKEDNSVF